jgi:tripartite-type tricarboxylate transporter receptor subunit TctC
VKKSSATGSWKDATATGRFRKRLDLVFTLVLAVALYDCARAAEIPYYQGKTITILEGRTAGGTGSLRTRAGVKYLLKYLSGEPSVSFQYMPAVGGVGAANHIVTVAKRDGLTIGNVSGGVFSSAIFKAPQVRYSLEDLVFLGSGNPGSPTTLSVRPALRIDSVEKLKAYNGLRFANRSVGHSMYIRDRLVCFVLELKNPRWVLGYSESELNLALERGEADAMMGGIPGFLREVKDWLKQGFTVPIILKNVKGVGAEAYPEFPQDRPTLDQHADTEMKRAILRLNDAANPGGSIFFVHKDIPAAALKALREAFDKVWKDPQFLDEYEQMTGEKADPMTTEDFEKLLQQMPRDLNVIEAYKQLLSAGPLPPSR